MRGREEGKERKGWEEAGRVRGGGLDIFPGASEFLVTSSLFRRDLKTFLFHSVYGHQDITD